MVIVRKLSVVLILASIIQCNSFSQNKKYCTEYPQKCKRTISFLYSNKLLFNSIAEKYDCDPLFLYSIVAPEVSMFSNFEETWQTSSMELLYCKIGLSYANFSLGYFQMKPSWTEALEAEIERYHLSRFERVFEYNCDNVTDTRKERLRRLKSIEWQYKYLVLFYHIMEIRFSKQKFNDINEKLKFYSAAYNSSFNAPSTEIIKWTKLKFFPRGKYGSEFTYSEVSNEIYLKILEIEMFNP